MEITRPENLFSAPAMSPLVNPPGQLMAGNAAFDFNLLIPKPFSLEAQSKSDKDKLRDEVMDKVKSWERRMNGFFNEYQVYADSWRVKSQKSRAKKPSGLFNSKSGETHRAAETLGTFWLRSLTATDQYFEAIGEGLDDAGQEVTQEQLYACEQIITKQLRVSHYKEKLLRALRSIAVFGTAIFEEPFMSMPYKNGTAKFEYTDFVFRSLLKTAFDTGVWDINMSDFIATIDFPNKYLLKRWSKSQGEYWDSAAVQEYLDKVGDLGMKDAGSLNKSTGVWDRVNESKTRAGYTEIDNSVFELINYHGKIDTENPMVAAYWESEGRQDDPADFDFTIGVLNGDPVVRFHETQFGTWHSRFKVAHFKTFEDEALGYGVGRIGRRIQREIDTTLSRTNDTAMKGVYSMYLVGRYAGIKANQLGINPNGLVEVEDVDQVKPLPIDTNVIAHMLAMIVGNREEFRATVGAQTNLQGQTNNTSATEAAIAQTEGVRGASVHAEIIAETFLREHVETMHFNNLEYLDEPIWVSSTGEEKPGYFNRENLPRSIGIQMKIVTDKDFNRTERAASVLKGLELWSSIRNNFPPSVNAIPELAKEWFRMMNLNPRLLTKPMSVQDQLGMALKQAQQNNQAPALGNELAGEAAGAQAGSGANIQSTPVGLVPTSPLASAASVPGL